VKVLVTGGNDIFQRAIAAALLERSHAVRVAVEDSARATGWPAPVDLIFIGDGSHDLRDAAAGCDAIVVVDPSVTPAPRAGETTPAARTLKNTLPTGLPRVVHVIASHAAPVEGDGGAGHLTIRTSPVYGVGDDLVTVFLIMMRSLPVVPILGGSHATRPIWYEDLARAVAASVSIDGMSGVVDVAGPDRVTQDELYERVAALTDRRPLRVPVPDFIAGYGSRLAEGLRMTGPFDASHLAFVRAGSGDEPRENAIATVFGLAPTSLGDGLRRLVRGLPELTPGEGVGSVEVKRFSIRIAGGRYNAAELLRAFRARFREVMPVDIGVEPGAPETVLTEGAVVTVALPGRGHVQVRVEDASDDRIVLSTLRGHALAGFVQFRARTAEEAIEFEVMTCDAAANAMDWLTLTLGGARIQDANWTRLLVNVASLAGGSAAPVKADARKLDPEEAASVDRWIRAVVSRHKTPPVSGTLPRV
jgi:NADH dehydrogenase